jgi:hypothetical protein
VSDVVNKSAGASSILLVEIETTWNKTNRKKTRFKCMPFILLDFDVFLKRVSFDVLHLLYV